ncbi:hypothetical protein MN116_000986 [Schistosoma mekongi]|uniref:Uncharacterized protein n=1 Tax=Schistosoma mekongi TaxID=38744 RepID=A0AAE1ZL73_SCHME|nr:hypothetical protein MN116_000986 [Schistosoma mekongi]
METLDTKWIHIKSNDCERTESSPATLGLTNMAGVFIMIGMGLVAGAILTLVEVLCAKRKGEQKKKLELSTVAVQHWRDNIQKRHSERYFPNIMDKQMQLYHNDKDKHTPQDVIQSHLLTNINMETSNNIKCNLLMNAKEIHSTTEYDILSTKSKMSRKRKASDDYSNEDDYVNDTQLFPYHITKNNNSLNKDYCITAYRCDQHDSDDDDDDDSHNDELVEKGQEQQDNEEEELMNREYELTEEDLNELIHHNNTFSITNINNKNNHYHRHHKWNIVSAV